MFKFTFSSYPANDEGLNLMAALVLKTFGQLAMIKCLNQPRRFISNGYQLDFRSFLGGILLPNALIYSESSARVLMCWMYYFIQNVTSLLGI